MIHFKSRKRPGKYGMRLGLSRAAATDYSPGLQPWVDGLKRARPESGARHWIVWPRDNETSSANTFGRHFSSFVPCPPTMADRQGASFGDRNPGLKPWAMICSRFAATDRKSTRLNSS